MCGHGIKWSSKFVKIILVSDSFEAVSSFFISSVFILDCERRWDSGT